MDNETLKRLLLGRSVSDIDGPEIILELQSYGFRFDSDLLLNIMSMECGAFLVDKILNETDEVDEMFKDPKVMNTYLKSIFIYSLAPLSKGFMRLFERRPGIILKFYLTCIREAISKTPWCPEAYMSYDDKVISWAIKNRSNKDFPDGLWEKIIEVHNDMLNISAHRD